MHILSLGAGVQSSTLALMAAAGEIEPMPECGIFADTQAEPQSVYRWLDYLEKQLPFQIYRVTAGNLAAESTRIRKSKTGTLYTKSFPPAFTSEHGKPSGLLMRQCTQDYKLHPIFRKMRQLTKGPVTQWIGISWDELQRVRTPKQSWLTNHYPLIDRRMTRLHCIEWMAKRGYPTPPRSSCSFCPYHSNDEWRRLRDEEPEAFADAVEYEKRLQAAFSQASGFRGLVYLHRDLKPINEVDLSANESQGEFGFEIECEGMCGV